MKQDSWLVFQARGFMGVTFNWTGMPVPPEGQPGVLLSEETRDQFLAGEGGPLAANPGLVNGVYGPPLGGWRVSGMLQALTNVCIPALLHHRRLSLPV